MIKEISTDQHHIRFDVCPQLVCEEVRLSPVLRRASRERNRTVSYSSVSL